MEQDFTMCSPINTSTSLENIQRALHRPLLVRWESLHKIRNVVGAVRWGLGPAVMAEGAPLGSGQDLGCPINAGRPARNDLP